MPLAFLFVGIILIVSAVRNTWMDLFKALGQDVPDFVIWAAALIAVGAIGFVPGLKPVSRGLLALVMIVLIMNNYRAIGKGFRNAWDNPPKSEPSGATPAKSGGSSGGPDIGSVVSVGKTIASFV